MLSLLSWSFIYYHEFLFLFFYFIHFWFEWCPGFFIWLKSSWWTFADTTFTSIPCSTLWWVKELGSMKFLKSSKWSTVSKVTFFRMETCVRCWPSWWHKYHWRLLFIKISLNLLTLLPVSVTKQVATIKFYWCLALHVSQFSWLMHLKLLRRKVFHASLRLL